MSQHVIRCIRCSAISLCLCRCYLQMNTVLSRSEHALVHSALRWRRRDYFSKQWDTLPVLFHPCSPSLTPPDLSLLFPLIPPPLCTMLCPLYLRLGPSNFTFSYICCVFLISLLTPISLPLPSPSVSFSLGTSKSHIFSLTSFNPNLPQSCFLFSAG